MAEGVVERRLAQLDREIEGLQPKLDAARSAWAEARTPEDRATAKEIYEKLEMEKKELLAERRALEAKLPVGGGPGPSSAAAGSKRIVVIKPGGVSQEKRIKDQGQLDNYLQRMDFECFRTADGVDVDDVENLVEGKEYFGVPKRTGIASRVEDLVQHTRHLTTRREEEFGEALVVCVAQAEGVSVEAVHKRPELREIYTSDGKTREVEVDAVVSVDGAAGPTMYIGSTKTYCNGDTDIKLLKNTIDRLEVVRSSDEPGNYAAFRGHTLKGAFMAESLGKKGADLVPKAIQARGFMQLRRGSGGIIRASACRLAPATPVHTQGGLRRPKLGAPSRLL